MKNVKLLLIPSVVAALSLAACAEEQRQKVCVNTSGGNPNTQLRVDDKMCSTEAYHSAGSAFYPYYWFYLSGMTRPGIGYPIQGHAGTYNTPTNWAHYSGGVTSAGISAASVSRGGFGSSARGFGGGAGA